MLENLMGDPRFWDYPPQKIKFMQPLKLVKNKRPTEVYFGIENLDL